MNTLFLIWIIFIAAYILFESLLTSYLFKKIQNYKHFDKTKKNIDYDDRITKIKTFFSDMEYFPPIYSYPLGTGLGHYNHFSKEIIINSRILENDSLFYYVIGHELQHAYQDQKENRAYRGARKSKWKSVFIELDAHKKGYQVSEALSKNEDYKRLETINYAWEALPYSTNNRTLKNLWLECIDYTVKLKATKKRKKDV